MSFLICPDCSQCVANLYSHDCPKAKSSGGRTDEAKAREEPQVGGRRKVVTPSHADDRRKRNQAGVGSERSSLPEAKKSSRGGGESRPAVRIASGSSEASAKPVAKGATVRARNLEQGGGIRSGAEGVKSSGQSAGVAPGPRETKLKAGRPKIVGQRPWEKEGVSRRTWYRRKAEGRK